MNSPDNSSKRDDLDERTEAKQGREEILEPLQCVYFYYATPGSDPKHPDIKAYVELYPNAIGNIEKEIETLAKRAKTDPTMKPAGWAMGDLRWRRKSYLVVVLDHNDMKFGSEKALRIEDKDKCFEAKKIITFKLDGNDVQAIYCRNKFKDKDGNDINGDHDHPDHEEYDIYLDLVPKTLLSEAPPLTHADTGQNIGPRLTP
jgi:hypothetical protein